jgi:uncharacterized RmlC-like cupin family protein
MSGIEIVRPGDRDRSTAQTSGMTREAGVCETTTAAKGIWSGYVRTEAGTASGVHHHGDCESAIYVISGRARFRWGPKLEHFVDAGPGDFLYVPPNEVHMEENLSDTEPLQAIVSRNCSGMTTINVPDPRDEAHHH